MTLVWVEWWWPSEAHMYRDTTPGSVWHLLAPKPTATTRCGKPVRSTHHAISPDPPAGEDRCKVCERLGAS